MVLRALGLVSGLLVGAALFEVFSRLLSGMPHGWLWHIGIATGAGAVLLLSRRAGGARLALIAGSLVLAGLTAASALIFPVLVRSWAETAAAGDPWCLLGPDLRNGDYRPDKLSYLVTAPLGRQDLTYLALPVPLMLVVETRVGAGDELSAEGDDPALKVQTLDLAARRFSDLKQPVLDLDRTSMLLDCVPAPDAFAGAAKSETYPVAVIWRPVQVGADGAATLGSRQRDIFHLPASAAPLRGSRLSSAAIGVSLDLVPGSAAMPVRLQFSTDPVGALKDDLASYVRNEDQPMDFAGLPLDDYGLQALVYPSTSVTGASVGTYAALSPDGTPKTVIACDEFRCVQRFRPDLPGNLPLVVSVTYPLDLRSDWTGIEQAAEAQVLAMLAPR